jgi:hypothetical protein
LKGFNFSLIFVARLTEQRGNAEQKKQLDAADLNRAQKQGSI